VCLGGRGHRPEVPKRGSRLEREAESAANVLMCLALGQAVSSRFNYLPLGIGAMVLTHGLQGWYPMLPLFRRLGFRTAEEIYQERNLLKPCVNNGFGMWWNRGADYRSNNPTPSAIAPS
jgi:hypothetical protein